MRMRKISAELTANGRQRQCWYGAEGTVDARCP